MSKTTILEDYKAELEAAKQMKFRGILMVSPSTAGVTLAAGRVMVPIDEYIAHWQNGITAMENGADMKQFNY